jgi:hypothetical protein
MQNTCIRAVMHHSTYILLWARLRYADRPIVHAIRVVHELSADNDRHQSRFLLCRQVNPTASARTEALAKAKPLGEEGYFGFNVPNPSHWPSVKE